MAMGLPDRAPVTARSDSDPDSIPDAVLVRRLIDGSEAALAELYDRHATTVYAAAVRVARDPGIAAEVVQETFLALWDRAELFDPSIGSLRAWLHTIARNRAVDRLRANRRHDRAASFSTLSAGSVGDDDGSLAEWLVASGTPVAMSGPEPSPEAVIRDRETRRSLAAAIAILDPNEREVIELAYAAGLSQSEVAERLGWPLGTVKTRTRRALRRLREHLEAGGTLTA
jgi:RNA polymerase sigma-70 factor (ECF subfamily)